MVDYSEETVEFVIEELGIDIVHRSGGWGTAKCPLHEDDKPSFTINLIEGGWKCYSGCGSSYDLAELVSLSTGEKIENARRRLSNLFIGDSSLIERMFGPKEKKVETYIEPLFYERGSTYSYLLERGFTKETLKRWDVGKDSSLKMVVVPIKYEGKIVGLWRRSTKGKEFRNSFGEWKHKYLFGWDLVDPNTHTVCLCESPLNAMWLDQFGYPALATLGATLSEEQAALIRKRYWTVILAYDNDKAGEMGAKKVQRLLDGLRIFTISIPNGYNDVQDIRDKDLLVETMAKVKEYVS